MLNVRIFDNKKHGCCDILRVSGIRYQVSFCCWWLIYVSKLTGLFPNT
jgi:hypothetical protein